MLVYLNFAALLKAFLAALSAYKINLSMDGLHLQRLKPELPVN